MSTVGSSSTVQAVVILRALGGKCVRGPVVGDGCGEDRDVDVREREGGVEHRLGGRGRDRLDSLGRGHGEIGREQDHVRAAAAGLFGERDPHAARRTVAEEPHGVERLARAARGDEDALPGEAPRREQLLGAARDLVRLGHAADAPLALGGLALVRPDELDAARGEGRSVGTRRGMRPHARVHGRRDEHGAAVSEGGLGEEVVGDALRQLRKRVRRAGRDDEDVGARQVGVEIVGGRPAREGVEGLGRDEALGAGRDERDHLVARLDEQARQLAGLVRGDPAGDAEKDPAHALIVPSPRRRKHALRGFFALPRLRRFLASVSAGCGREL